MIQKTPMLKTFCWIALKLMHNKQERYQYRLNGAVQGVGFRPFVYRLATEHRLSGWVQNNTSGIIIEVEGTAANITSFEKLLQKNKPSNAVVDHFVSQRLELEGEQAFRIIESDPSKLLSVSILPDLAVCQDCLAEMNDPKADRHYRYPFINCTNCGPRFTIIKGLPYDRQRTSMATFAMCDACRAEYENPLDRRFHAQPIACLKCGPHLELWDKNGVDIAKHEDALMQAVSAVRQGKIIALKGLGGFHLIADATNEEVVQTLRKRKSRPRKPFAVMVQSGKDVDKYCDVSEDELILLTSSAAPIVLLPKKPNIKIAKSIAPDNPFLGMMLPYTPLHHLILQELNIPIIATSGNRHDEPICIDEYKALECLSDIADLFLVNNRPINHGAEDSVVRIMAERDMVLRRGRGYAPLPITIDDKLTKPIFSVGGDMKNTVALALADKLILSPHIGDLNTPQSCENHDKMMNILCDLYEVEPDMVFCDKHPNYRSSRAAQALFSKVTPVQHHYAHALSCLLDNEIDPPALAVVWDGTGYGDDGTIWGGEFLQITDEGYERVFHFKSFPLPGAEAAVKDPRRTAYGLLHEAELHRSLGFSAKDETLLYEALNRKINCPLTSSVGRLFDAVSALTGVSAENSFEGEAAMALEFAAMKSGNTEIYDFVIKEGIINWQKMLGQILSNIDEKVSVCDIARKFHNTLSAIIVSVAKEVGWRRVLLTGGCFQNKLLLQTTISTLKTAGFEPYWHHRIPTGDGGIAAGQIMAAIQEQKKESR